MSTNQVKVGWKPYVDSGLDVSATAFSNAAGITDSTQKSAINMHIYRLLTDLGCSRLLFR